MSVYFDCFVRKLLKINGKIGSIYCKEHAYTIHEYQVDTRQKVVDCYVLETNLSITGIRKYLNSVIHRRASKINAVCKAMLQMMKWIVKPRSLQTVAFTSP
jgi:hypothetical protein